MNGSVPTLIVGDDVLTRSGLRGEFRPPLTSRESEVLVLIARGFSNQEIADGLVLSLETVRSHVKHIYRKSGARDRAQAVIAAYESGLVRRSH